MYKKKLGDRVNFKILCHENLKINFARPKLMKLPIKEIKASISNQISIGYMRISN